MCYSHFITLSFPLFQGPTLNLFQGHMTTKRDSNGRQQRNNLNDQENKTHTQTDRHINQVAFLTNFTAYFYTNKHLYPGYLHQVQHKDTP